MSRQIFQYHPTFGFQFIPGLRARIEHETGGYLVRVNQQGFRCEHDFAPAKPPGKFRALLFGDSFTAGDGVKNPERYGDLLEESIPGLEVYNLGLPGTGTDQQYLIYREWAGKLDHDMVIISVLVENVRRVAVRYRLNEAQDGSIVACAKPYYSFEPDGGLRLNNVPVPRDPIPAGELAGDEAEHVDWGGAGYDFLRERSVNKLGPWVKDKVQWLTRYQPLPEYDDPDGPSWKLMRAILSGWLDEARKPVVLFLIPLYQYVEQTSSPESYRARFAELVAGREGVVLHDPLADLWRRPAAERRQMRFPKDVHLTPLGHRCLAESLAARVGPAVRQSIGEVRLMAVNVLGISALYHDSAAALARDGEVVAAAQEERFSRKKHDPRFPNQAIGYCLEEAFIDPGDLAAVVFYDNPALSFDRVLKSLLTVAPDGQEQWSRAVPSMLGTKLRIEQSIRSALGADVPILVTRHHLAHAASAFYPSPFEDAAILTIDGVGEWATTSLAVGEGPAIRVLEEIHYPHSLGLLYSAVTYFCGFKVNSGEYKLMGLAPYGTPRFAGVIRDKLIRVQPDGSYRLDMHYLGYLRGNVMTSPAFEELFEGPPRPPESQITRREMDLAASVQLVTEEVVLALARRLRDLTGLEDLTMAGGVALNCVANGRLLRERVFKRIWIQPAAGDAGGALGAALLASHRKFGVPRRRSADGRDTQRGSYLGPKFSGAEVRAFLDRNGYPYEVIDDLPARSERIARTLAEGKVVGLLSGRMEFGPRSLGARSILGDPRNPETQVLMNLKIKYRESFRPFAPTVLAERCADYFELDEESPYMLLVAPVRRDRQLPMDRARFDAGDDDMLAVVRQPRSDVPAVTHIDYSARIQTVHPADQPDYYAIVKAFERQTGCGVVVNTSFNVRGEPIVCSPRDAYRCFMRTGIELLVLEDCLLWKDQQPAAPADESWRTEYELD